MYFHSDYDSSTGSPMTPATPLNETLSPIEQIFGMMSSGGRQTSRTRQSPYNESDTSGFSSEGSEAALVEMMVSV